tara:strand:- start:1293 stop:1409 length:117 start_codon:yes stop_codon:yes gene_type:complete
MGPCGPGAPDPDPPLDAVPPPEEVEDVDEELDDPDPEE